MIADQRFLCRGQAAHRDLGLDIMARLDVIAEEGTTLVAAHFLLQRIEVAEDALRGGQAVLPAVERLRSEEHTSELQSLMRISYAVFCLKKKNKNTTNRHTTE